MSLGAQGVLSPAVPWKALIGDQAHLHVGPETRVVAKVHPDRTFAHQRGGGGVVFISERSELELIGDKYAETALHNGGGLERMSGGEPKSGRAMPELGSSGKCNVRNMDIGIGVQRSARVCK